MGLDNTGRLNFKRKNPKKTKTKREGELEDEVG
jgi:hypothetical protein